MVGYTCGGSALWLSGYRGRLPALGVLVHVGSPQRAVCQRSQRRVLLRWEMLLVTSGSLEQAEMFFRELNKAFLVKANAPGMMFRGITIKRETKTTHEFGLNLAVQFGEGRRENLEEVQMFALFQKDQK